MQNLELPNGSYTLPPGKLANIAHRLEMRQPPNRHLKPWPNDLHLEAITAQNLAAYREVFRTVGQDFLWFSRLLMEDEKLLAILSNPNTHSFTLKRGATTIGILELSFRDLPDCELSFFGLIALEIGTGLGQVLIDEAIRRSFEKPISRLWLSTCSLDHPRALSFYQKAGFKPYARILEIHDDPRLQNHLPLNAATHIPLLP
jgi:ribosomal protein S18 acetylase RimI-like enzyme